MEGVGLLYEQDIDGGGDGVQNEDIYDDPFYSFAMNDPVNGQEVVAADQDAVGVIVEQVVRIANALPVIGDSFLRADDEEEQREIADICLSIRS